ncbi:NAD-dependent epimerase/dehydratase family protein [Fontibacter flavus]|uniref:NAD-dependent epimerase/dehydratase family protein n=1 Tax=Fontibacter flavus TaxID=654838 RepID=A0ABV6FVK6_9BACT
MKLLITGIHGFVGRNLVRAWKGEMALYGLDILQEESEGIVQTFSWDELDRILAVDIIIHLAGKAHDTKNTSSAQAYFDINLRLTEQIFDYFLQSEAKHFVFFSSVKAVADKVAGEYLTEDVSPKPATPYGQSKLAAEQYILSKKLPEGKKIYILRPCMIHGPGNKGNLNLLYQLAKKGIPWPLGAFENQRSFLSVDNLIFVLRELLNQDLPSGIYQVADDEAISTNELIEMIAASMGKKAKIWKVSRPLIEKVALLGNSLKLPLNTERLQKLTENYVVSNQKIMEALQKPLPLSAREGMMRTLRSFED